MIEAQPGSSCIFIFWIFVDFEGIFWGNNFFPPIPIVWNVVLYCDRLSLLWNIMQDLYVKVNMWKISYSEIVNWPSTEKNSSTRWPWVSNLHILFNIKSCHTVWWCTCSGEPLPEHPSRKDSHPSTSMFVSLSANLYPDIIMFADENNRL